MIDDFPHMRLALEEARAAAERGEVPLGAVVVDPAGHVVASAGNRTRADNDPSAHAEMLALRAACRAQGCERLPGYDLYVTLEPCAMCASVISFARIRRLYYGAADAKSGGVSAGPRLYTQPTLHHKPDVYSGIMGHEAARLLRDFFGAMRGENG